MGLESPSWSKVCKVTSYLWQNRCLCFFKNSSSVSYWSLFFCKFANPHLYQLIITDDNLLRGAPIGLNLSFGSILFSSSTIVVVAIADIAGVRQRRVLYLDLRRSEIAWDWVLYLLLLTRSFEMLLNMHSWHLWRLHEIIILKAITFVFW